MDKLDSICFNVAVVGFINEFRSGHKKKKPVYFYKIFNAFAVCLIYCRFTVDL